MILVFLGPPGAGKGTQAKILEDRFGYRQISTGDMLRKHRADKTALGLEAQSYMDAGKLVPDDLVIRMVEAELNKGGPVRVGNLEASRDFTDVRDVVRAYRLLALDGVAGEAYNVCSGQAIAIAALAEQMAGLLSCEVTFVQDPELFRPVEVPVLVGDASKLVAATGWHPSIELATTLSDVIDYWRGRLC